MSRTGRLVCFLLIVKVLIVPIYTWGGNLALVKNTQKSEHSGFLSEDDEFQVTFIVQATGQPIDSAIVHLDGYSDRVTNSNGIAIFSEVEAGDSIYYRIEALGFITYEDSLTVQDEDVEKTVRLERMNNRLEFMVKSAGEPVVDAEVFLQNYGTQTTDSVGRTVFEGVISSNNIYYSVSAQGFEIYEDSVKVVNNTVELVKLNPIGFEVKFIVKKDESYIADARIILSGYGQRLTNDDGEAVFSDIAPEFSIQYEVKVDGYSAYINAVNVINEDIVEIVEFSTPSYNVYFTVGADGNQIEGAKVVLDGYGQRTTNQNGQCFFVNVEKQNNIPYYIESDGFPAYEGELTMDGEDVYLEISLTGIINKTTESIEIYPNPSQEFIQFNLPVDSRICIFEENGRLNYSRFFEQGKVTINIAGFEQGSYFIYFEALKTGKKFIRLP